MVVGIRGWGNVVVRQANWDSSLWIVPGCAGRWHVDGCEGQANATGRGKTQRRQAVPAMNTCISPMPGVAVGRAGRGHR